MLLNRLKWKLVEPHQNICSFAEWRSAADSITSLLAEVNNRPAIIVFLNLKKAFELASLTTITDRLAARGVSGRLLSWTHDYLSDRKDKERFQRHVSNNHQFENSTPQG
uniref:Reverse transcriptase domain-containing protein n=1 Tax=Scylla olivacea TaxID=85551 RepID=A0A0P4W178_SCYOL